MTKSTYLSCQLFSLLFPATSKHLLGSTSFLFLRPFVFFDQIRKMIKDFYKIIGLPKWKYSDAYKHKIPKEDETKWLLDTEECSSSDIGDRFKESSKAYDVLNDRYKKMFYDENFKRYEGRENDLEEHNLTGSTEIKKNYLEFSDAAFDDAGRKSNNQSSTKSNSINISRHSSRNNSLSGQSCSRSRSCINNTRNSGGRRDGFQKYFVIAIIVNKSIFKN